MRYLILQKKKLPDTHDDPELIEYKLVDWATLAPTLYELGAELNTCMFFTKKLFFTF